MEKQDKLYTISIYSGNSIGLLNRVSAIFQRRKINIESINISKSEIERVSRFTILIKTSRDQINTIITQIERQVEVIKACYHTDEETIYQESCLFKIRTDLLFDKDKRQIQNVIKEYNIKFVTVNKSFFVLEKSGKAEEIIQIYEKLSEFGIMQFVRSARIAITKEEMRITNILNEELKS